MSNKTTIKFAIAVFVLLAFAVAGFGQISQPSTAQNNPPVGKTVFFDSDGNKITNNEFVDIRMANFHIKDATRMVILEDGTVEFRLQKVPQEGVPMPSFVTQTIDDKPFNTNDLKGKVIVLNFWFIGCPICLGEMSTLNNIAAKYDGDDDVVFVAVTADSKTQVKHFLSRTRFDYRMISDGKAILDSFGFTGYPKNIVIGRDGNIAYWRSTIHAWDKFESVITGELGKK